MSTPPPERSINSYADWILSMAAQLWPGCNLVYVIERSNEMLVYQAMIIDETIKEELYSVIGVTPDKAEQYLASALQLELRMAGRSL